VTSGMHRLGSGKKGMKGKDPVEEGKGGRKHMNGVFALAYPVLTHIPFFASGGFFLIKAAYTG